jgi:cytoskeletal protein RodZ
MVWILGLWNWLRIVVLAEIARNFLSSIDNTGAVKT